MEEHQTINEVPALDTSHSLTRTLLTSFIGVTIALALLLGGFFLGRVYVKNTLVQTNTPSGTTTPPGSN